MSTAKDRRFLHVPPYGWEIGVVAAAAAIWKLAKTADREESERDQAGSAAIPPTRTQA